MIVRDAGKMLADRAGAVFHRPGARLPGLGLVLTRPRARSIRVLERVTIGHLESAPLDLFGLDVPNGHTDAVVDLVKIANRRCHLHVRAYFSAHRRPQVVSGVLEDGREDGVRLAASEWHGGVIQKEPALVEQIRGGRHRVDAAFDVCVEVAFERRAVLRGVEHHLLQQLQQKNVAVLLATVGVDRLCARRTR